MSTLVIDIIQINILNFKFCLSETRQLHTFADKVTDLLSTDDTQRGRNAHRHRKGSQALMHLNFPMHIFAKQKKRLQLRVPFWILEVLYHCPGFWIPAIPAGWVYAARLPAGTMDLLSLLPTHTVLYSHTHFVQTHWENLSHR